MSAEALPNPALNTLQLTGEVVSAAVSPVVQEVADTLESVQETVLDATETVQKTALTLRQRITYGTQAAIVGAEFTPVNEAIRLSAFTAGEIASGGNPLVGAATFGLSTLAIEGSAALASARLLTTESSDRFNRYLRTRLEKAGYDKDSKLSPVTKATATFLGGSVVGMALENFDNPGRSLGEQQRYGIKTAAWLAGSCAIIGAAGSETIDFTTQNPAVALALAGTAGTAAIGRKVHRTMTKRREAMQPEIERPTTTTWVDRDRRRNITIGILRDEKHLAQATELEQAVWDEKQYGNLVEEGYDVYNRNSVTYGAFDKQGECVGMSRTFQASETVVPPFLSDEMPFYDETERQELADMARTGVLEEMGTFAVNSELRGKGLNMRLFRAAMRDALERGVTHWGIIMEPERVEKMSKYQGMVTRRLGEAIDYQGGACAAHVMDLHASIANARRKHPLVWYMMVKAKTKA